MKLLHPFRVWRSRRREKAKEKTRSTRWPTVRDHAVAKAGKCAACAGTVELQVHHIVPFHTRPDLELVEINLIVLCMGPLECHLLIGHGGSFECYDPSVHAHAKMFATAVTPNERRSVQDAARVARKPNVTPG